MHFSSSLVAILVAPSVALAQVVGKPYGFAAGVTGGGNAAPAVPKDIAQLKSWLSDNTPRVIKIDKTFNFLGSEGTVTEQGCRLKEGCNASNGGQDTIKAAGCDANENRITVKYDRASYLGMAVGSNKSLIGVGNKGVLLGKGLRFNAGAKNIIIQNIHIDNLNPQYVWGGDAISLSGNDGVWIDHVKISNVGRQMFVSHYEASRVTISNTEFDGRTTYSNSCNGDHYWTMIMGGQGDKITFDRNYIHDTSGRAPKIGSSAGNQFVQAVNNLFSTNTGHNFDITASGRVLIEGNRFVNSKTPITTGSDGKIFSVPDASSQNTCTSSLGRKCELNSLSGSGAWRSLKASEPLSELSKYKSNLVTPISVGSVETTVKNNAGIGKI